MPFTGEEQRVDGGDIVFGIHRVAEVDIRELGIDGFPLAVFCFQFLQRVNAVDGHGQLGE